MKKQAILLFIYALSGLPGLALAVDPGRCDEKNYEETSADRVDPFCAGVGVKCGDNTKPLKDGEGDLCDSDSSGSDDPIAVKVRQRIEAIIDRTIAMEYEQEAEPEK